MSVLPPPTALDAKNRAWRTFAQGLLFDVLLAVSMTLTAAIAAPDFVWSGPYLSALGLSLAKSVLTAAFAYIGRKVMPPNP